MVQTGAAVVVHLAERGFLIVVHTSAVIFLFAVLHIMHGIAGGRAWPRPERQVRQTSVQLWWLAFVRCLSGITLYFSICSTIWPFVPQSCGTFGFCAVVYYFTWLSLAQAHVARKADGGGTHLVVCILLALSRWPHSASLAAFLLSICTHCLNSHVKSTCLGGISVSSLCVCLRIGSFVQRLLTVWVNRHTGANRVSFTLNVNRFRASPQLAFFGRCGWTGNLNHSHCLPYGMMLESNKKARR
jgi:hypothetical protein